MSRFYATRVRQSCQESFEIIVVATPGRPDFESAARTILRSHDRYIVAEFAHEIEGYAIGADAARGDWLFLTESHVSPNVNCLREVLAFLADGSIDAGVVRSVSIHHTKIGRVEGKCFAWQMDSARRRQPDHLPLHLRGFVVRRDVFLRNGGLPAGYKTYALDVLGFHLAQTGIRVQWIDRAVVRHVECATFQAFVAAVRDTTQGECIFAHTRRPQCETLTAIPWRPGAVIVHRALLQTAAFAGRRLPPRRRIQFTLHLLHEFVHHASQGHSATRLRWLAARATCLWSRICFALTRRDSDEELFRFIRMWRRIVAVCRLEYAARTAQHVFTDPGSAPTELAAMYNDQLAGFHGLESHAGRIFRWSRPIAEIAVSIPAADHRFLIDTMGLRGDVGGLAYGLFVNGHRVPYNEVAINQGLIIFSAPSSWIVQGRPTRILILSEPLQEPRQSDGQHGRRLGLPFFDFRTEAIPQNP